MGPIGICFEDEGETSQSQNSQAAMNVCRAMGIEEGLIREGMKSFVPPPHRMEFVTEWRGIACYNDSKSTNVDAVRYAVALCKEPIILLVGGVDKGASYRSWIRDFQGKVKRVVAFGQAAKKIQEELEVAYRVECVSGLKEAVQEALSYAKKGDTLLLSPGCSSFDQFSNYEHRGNEFKRIIKEELWTEKKLS
jgi:UDP-N-acetylmuramoylalanine--D-glutamate ligase